MAEKIISPGVFTRENDLSFLPQGIGEIGAAIIGPFKKGPAFVPTVVDTQQEFEEIFGRPDGTYYTGYTVQNYLREAGTATIVRVGHVGGYSHTVPLGIKVSGSEGESLIGSLHVTSNGDESVGFPSTSIDSQVSQSAFSISGSELGEYSASIDPSAGNDLRDVFGTSPFGSKNGYTYTYFEQTAEDFAATHILSGSSVEVIELPTQDFSLTADGNDEIRHATTPWVQSQLISDERYDLFRFHTLGDGNEYNREFKVSIFNVKAAGESNATDYTTFSILIRGFSDSDRRPTILETYSSVNLDPSSPNYIARVIGDQNRTIDSTGKLSENGDYRNRSNYVRVEVKDEGSFPITAAPFAHKPYANPIYIGGDESLVPSVMYATGSDENTGNDTTNFSGIDLETAVVKLNNYNYLNPIPNSAEELSSNEFSFDGDITINQGDGTTTFNFGYEMTGSLSADTNKRQFTIGFQRGFDGVSPTVSTDKGVDLSAGNSQGFNLSTSTSSGSVAYTKAINAVSNPDDFDINLVTTPGVVRRLHSYVFDYVVDMVEARQDAFFIGDVVGMNDTISQAIDQASAVNSNYAGTYYPWVKTIDVNTNKLTPIPPSVLMPGIYAANDANAAEWYAPAGLNRGGITGAVNVLNRLKRSERDDLYEGKVNPIATFPGEGIVAFGQKTLQDASSALDRINVRRLLIKVKKFIASTSKYLVFEQNTSQTRNRFLNTVNPYLEGIQQRQGLYAFRVVMDESNNTPDVIDRNILAGEIFLQPTRTAEFIVLDFSILPTGATFSS